MTKTEKPKRKQRDFLEDWEPIPMQYGSQTRSPERELWATVIGLAVTSATKRKCELSLYWINQPSFLQLCGMLDLHPDTGKRIRDEVNRRFAAVKARIIAEAEQVTKPCKELASAAPYRPWKPLPTVTPALAPANAAAPVSGPLDRDPAPVVVNVNGWPFTLEWIPLPKKTRKRRLNK